MTLDHGKKGEAYVVEELNLPLKLEKRLEALGMTAGTRIDVLNDKSKGTLIVNVRGTRFALGRGITKNITVRE
jgi:ferrous iron transport protein A